MFSYFITCTTASNKGEEVSSCLENKTIGVVRVVSTQGRRSTEAEADCFPIGWKRGSAMNYL